MVEVYKKISNYSCRVLYILLYSSHMANTPLPLSLPAPMKEAVKSAAKDTGLSQQDIMRQAITRGLPILLAGLGKTTAPLASAPRRRRAHPPATS